MKKIFSIVLAGVVAFGTVTVTNSCSKDFLEEDAGHMVSDGLLNTAEGAQAMAAGLYANLRWHFGYEWAYGITLYGCDEFTNGADLTSEPWNTYDSRLQALDCTTALGAANNNCPPVSGLWDEMYYGISTANLVLSKATDPTSVGEAHFLRGYNYFRLFSQYGAVVLQLEPTGTNTKANYKRATEEETLNAVIQDFRDAYENLPSKSSRGQAGWDKSTAAHFLAKALLYRQSERCSSWNGSYNKTQDLDEAIRFCDEVIAAHPLVADYNDLYANWTGINCAIEGSTEILMAAHHGESNAGRFGNRTYNYFDSQFSNYSGAYVQRGQYIGGMDFQRCRPTEYSYAVFDNVNDARMWKTFKTIYGYNDYKAPSDMQSKGCPAGAEPALGDNGIVFILNTKDDPRFITGTNGATQFGTLGRAGEKHDFVDPATGKWVPNVVSVYCNGQYEMDKHGASGSTATCNFFCGINKTADGTRTAEKGDAHRDVTMARTGETYLVKAECQVREGKYDAAIATINVLRARAQWKNGEDRSAYVDGSIAFEKGMNSTSASTTPKGNKLADGKTKMTNMQAYQYSNPFKNTYYLSTGIEETTAASDLQIASASALPAEDEAILKALGCSGDYDRMINFIMNERTRELLGEWNRWEELSRCQLLVRRAKAFNPEAAANVQDRHNYRPIPQKFIDTLQDDEGNNLSDAEKAKWQNAGW